MNTRKNICVVTATRAEYGYLKWIMHEIRESSDFVLQLVVTGTHLINEQGHTIDRILQDGFTPSAVVDVQPDLSSTESIASYMGRLGEQFAHVLASLRPDCLVVLGDRYELMPIVSTAFVMRIPIAHLSGGDVTEGAIDNGIRNAITMMASYHFPGTEDSADAIRRMRGTDQDIWTIGEPGLDAFYREDLMSRSELAADLGIDSNAKWVLMTYHPETVEDMDYNMAAVKNCLNAVVEMSDVCVIVTYANADYGGVAINDYLKNRADILQGRMIAVPSLGTVRYWSLMREVAVIVGNSSSGIVEAPVLGVPVVNVGNRQLGRHICDNIICTDTSQSSVSSALKRALEDGATVADDYWGDGHAAERFVKTLCKVL